MGYSLSSFIFLGMLVAFLVKKLTLKRFTPILYWLTFTATSLAGTSISDFMDRPLGLGYTMGAAILLGLLLLVLWLWKVSEKSLSVEKIFTNKAENIIG
jgi:uncharacterized membrane-anchored protein